MRFSADLRNDPAVLLRVFYESLQEELRRTGEFMPEGLAGEFRDYYQRLLRRPLAGAALDTEVRGGLRSTYGLALERILRKKNGPPRVLDAGSGYGTECLLFAFAGAEVIGNDLREPRVQAAVRRAEFWRKETGHPLAVEFRAANIFDQPERSHFDLIWVHNAITHIHPVDGFLRLCRELLAPGGEVVIIDVNKSSLRRRFAASDHGHHGEEQYTRRIDPATGKEVVYAVERDLGLSEQCRLVREAGLEVSSRECYLGGHARAGEALWRGLLRPLARSLPVSSLFGNRYIVAGRRRD